VAWVSRPMTPSLVFHGAATPTSQGFRILAAMADTTAQEKPCHVRPHFGVVQAFRLRGAPKRRYGATPASLR
jgi:hypothetical protein